MINKIKSIFTINHEPRDPTELAYKLLFDKKILHDQVSTEALLIIVWLPGTPNLADLKEQILVEIALIIRLMIYFEIWRNLKGVYEFSEIQRLRDVIKSELWLLDGLGMPRGTPRDTPIMRRILESRDIDFKYRLDWIDSGPHDLFIKKFGENARVIGAAYYFLAEHALKEVCLSLKDSPQLPEIIGRWAPWFKSWHYRVREFCTELEKRYPTSCRYELVNTFDKKNSSQ